MMNSWSYEDASMQYMVEGMRSTKCSKNLVVAIKMLQDTKVANLLVFVSRKKSPEKLHKIPGSLTTPFRKMNPFLGVSK